MPVLSSSRVALVPPLILFLLAPLVGEVIGATLRFTYFAQPLRVLAILLFYGSGVVLIREAARTLGLNWWGIALLGLAYAIIEEGLALQTIFNPVGTGGEAVYGRALGTNWFWAVLVCGYHMVWSVLIPITVVEKLFPRRRKATWLSPRGRWLLVGLFGVGTGLFVVLSSLRSDYHLPLGHAAVALALVCGLAWAATRCTAATDTTDTSQALRRAPRPILVALAAFLAGTCWLVLHMVAFIGTPASFLWWTVGALALAAAVALLLRRWTRPVGCRSTSSPRALGPRSRSLSSGWSSSCKTTLRRTSPFR